MSDQEEQDAAPPDVETPFYRLSLDAAETYENSVAWTEGTDGPGASGKSLRIALAMKGGVSLAVWIGGAVAELDVLRRIRIRGSQANPTAYFVAPDPKTPPGRLLLRRADIYARILAVRGFDQVEYDILAGASAGGLNAILYGVAQRTGANVDALIDVWETSGDIWKLLRPPSGKPVPSVLTGDGYFWGRVAEAIDTYYAEPNDDHVSPQVVVDLSATIVDHDDRTEVDSREGRGHFHFIGSDRAVDDSRYGLRNLGTDGRNIPKTVVPDDIERLAYAARSTSSFPGAFEPALIWSPTTGFAAPAKPGAVDMSKAFAAHRPDLDVVGAPRKPRPFRVMDGGVIDNIPIDRAYRAVRTQPAESYTSRAVLYLDPDPNTQLSRQPTPPIDPPNYLKPSARRADKPSGFVRIILGALGLRGIRESGDDEVNDVDLLRRELYLEQGRSQTFSSAVRRTHNASQLAALRRNYVLYRGTADLDYISEVMKQPSIWQLGTDLTTRRAFTVDDDLVRRLDDGFIDAYNAAAQEPDLLDHAVLTGSLALIDFCKCSVAWIRDIEGDLFDQRRRQFRSTREDREALRADLYALSRRARGLRDEHLLTLLTSSGALSPRAIANKWLRLERTANTQMWSDAEDIVRRLRDLAPPDDAFPNSDRSTEFWAYVPEGEDAAKHLAPFVSGRGIPKLLWGLRFDQLTASEPMAVPGAFVELRRAQLAREVERWIKEDDLGFASLAVPKNVPTVLDAPSKLAGSTLANFGAFLSTDWRRNDWWWGRLDAAAGIVRFLQGYDPHLSQKKFGTPPTPKDIQSELLTEIGGSEDRPYPSDVGTEPEVVSRAMTAGRHTLKDLSPSYVVSVFSRVLRVALRATWPSSKPWLWPITFALLPPIAVVAPLVFAPLRLAAIGSLLLFLIGVGWDASTSTDAGSWIAFGLTGVGFLVALVVALRRIATNDDRRDASITVHTPEDRELLTPLKDAAKGAVNRFLAGAMLAVAAAFVLGYSDGPSGRFWFFAAAAFALLIVSVLRSGKLPTGHAFRSSNIAWIVIIAAMAALSLFWPALSTTKAALRFADALEAGHAACPLIPADPKALALAMVIAGSAAIITFGWSGQVGVGSGSGWPNKRPRWAVVWRMLAWAGISAAIGIGVTALARLIDENFGGNAVITAPMVAGVVVWFVTAQLVWWWGEIPYHRMAPVNDTAYRRRRAPESGSRKTERVLTPWRKPKAAPTEKVEAAVTEQ